MILNHPSYQETRHRNFSHVTSCKVKEIHRSNNIGIHINGVIINVLKLTFNIRD